MDTDEQRDYSEEQYNGNLCPACGASPCTWNGIPDGFHADEPEATDYKMLTNTKLIELSNDANDEAAYRELQERAASAGCLIRDLPRSL